MKKKHLIIVTVAMVLTSGILLAFNTKTSKSSSCSESMEKCCEKKDKTAPGGMLWETLSRQFFTYSGS
jgi:hypothetical protein